MSYQRALSLQRARETPRPPHAHSSTARLTPAAMALWYRARCKKAARNCHARLALGAWPLLAT